MILPFLISTVCRYSHFLIPCCLCLLFTFVFFLYWVTQFLLPVYICRWLALSKLSRENALVYHTINYQWSASINFFLSTPSSHICYLWFDVVYKMETSLATSIIFVFIVSNRKKIYVLQLFFKMNLVMSMLCCQSVWFF